MALHTVIIRAFLSMVAPALVLKYLVASALTQKSPTLAQLSLMEISQLPMIK